MSQTCNHVAAALHRVGEAVRSGLTNPSCTSKPNEWLPGVKAVVYIPAKRRDPCQKNLNKLTIPYFFARKNL